MHYTINGITAQRGNIGGKTANYDIFFRLFSVVFACFRGYLPLNYHWRLWSFLLGNRQARSRLPGVAASVWQYLAAVGPGFAPCRGRTCRRPRSRRRAESVRARRPRLRARRDLKKARRRPRPGRRLVLDRRRLSPGSAISCRPPFRARP